MLPLDDPAFIASVDEKKMLRCVDQLPDVALPAFSRGRACPLPPGEFRSVFICGMGGSAISGELLRTVAAKNCPWPVWVHRGDQLPQWVGDDTLCIFLSYSGNTAETLDTLREATQRNLKIVLITSGGSAQALAQVKGFPVVELPAGWQPRAAIGDLYFSLLGVVSQLPGFPPLRVTETAAVLQSARTQYGVANPFDSNPAKKLAAALLKKTPFILGVQGSTDSIAVRWKCQLNENAKTTALYGILPEFTHNDIVNLTAMPHPQTVIIKLFDAADTELVQRQSNHAMDLLRPWVGNIFSFAGIGETVLERQLHLLILGDYVSVYLGILSGFDPTPVDAIGELKRRMAVDEVHQVELRP
ncbi:MAG: bifunctional phosphoglucose/phosphomannose isomerase [Candidatus Sericytochromatia bacterium]|nr:bifunctional phosphoglucose/phosphomannose isomerase [Candidatus Sericytochromatia bacterium]